MRQAIAIAALLAAAAAAWFLWPRGDAVPAAREGSDAMDAAGAKPPSEASLKVTTDPRMKVFTRTETLAGTAPPSEVRGVVDGPEGAPLGGLRVTARSRVPFRPAATTVTEKDGAFRLQGVDDDLLDVLLGDIPDGWTASSALASAGGPALRMRLERKKPKVATEAVPVVITVLDYDGKPVVKARVKVQGRRDEKNFTTADSDATDAGGVAHVEVEDPGAHLWFAVERPEGRDDLFDVDVEGWKPHDETVRMRRSVTASGIVRIAGGTAWPFAEVHWRQGEGPWKRVPLVGEDGRFALARVEQSPVQFVAFMFPMKPPFPSDTRVTEADPAAGEISLVAAQPFLLAVRLGPLEGHAVEQVSVQQARAEDVWENTDWRWDPQDGEVLYSVSTRSARCQVYARRDDGKVAYATNLEIGPPDQPIVVPWTEGKDTRVFVKWPGGGMYEGSPFARGLGVVGVPAEDGKPIAWAEARARKKLSSEYLLRSVPVGTWKVVVGPAWTMSGWFEGSAMVAAGDTATIEMRKLSEAEIAELMERYRAGIRNR